MTDDLHLDRPIDLTIASLDENIDVIERDRLALEPVLRSLKAAGFYSYGTYDDQQRWTIAVDDESGRVDVRVGTDGYRIDLRGTSPGLFADEENEWKRKAHERLVRIMLPNIQRGYLAEHQLAAWDDVDQGVGVRISYELPFNRAEQIGGFVREHLPELEDTLALIESQIEI